MWEVLRLPAIGNFSFGKITLSFLAVIMSVFLWNIIAAPTTFAADVQWDGDNLKYQDQTYEPITDSVPDVPTGSRTYAYKQPDQGVAHVIFIPQDADMTQEFDATFRSYNFTPPGTYTNPQAARTVSVDAGGDTRSGNSAGAENRSGETQCAINGVGWMICPVSRWLATGMDVIFDLLKGYLEVKSVTLDTTSPLYRLWEVMRSFANIAFVAAFLLIIYSQVSGIGFSNYNIKKLLPRLIVAALLVNLSYYVCAIAVDISNILGYNLQQAFIDLRGGIVGNNTADNTEAASWEGMTAFILSGGTIAAAGTIGVLSAIGTGASILSAVFILVPFLLGVLVAVIVALLVLAARQALIVVLIAISPLAFVAYLLPNTEKWFDKWKDLFMTMLLLFPIFSVIFGGSQLAGAIIIQTATDMNILLLGMFVQVAPIVITPLLVKFSGGLLGRLAGMVNDPSKGIIDRTRNWTKEKDEEHRKRRIADGQRKGTSWKRPLQSWAVNRENGRHERHNRVKEYEAASEKAGEAHYRERLFGTRDEDGNVIEAKGNGLRARRTRALQQAHVATYQNDLTAQSLNALDETQKQAAQAGMSTLYAAAQDGSHGIVQSSQDLAVQNMAAQSAKRIVNSQLSTALEGDVALRKVAGGIDTKNGAQRALAQAITTRHSDRGEALKNINAIIDDVNPSAADELILATGGGLNMTMPDGSRKIIEHTAEIEEAAIKRIAGGGNVENIIKLGQRIDLSATSDIFLRTAWTESLKANSSKPLFYSAGLIDNMSQGTAPGFDGINNTTAIQNAVIDALNANKFDAAGLVKSDKSTLDILVQTLHSNPGAQTAVIADNIRTAIGDIVKNEDFKGAMGNRKDYIKQAGQSVGFDFTGVNW